MPETRIPAGRHGRAHQRLDHLRRAFVAALIVALLAIAAAPLQVASPRAAASGPAPKAVVIVGPAHGSTSYFLSVGAAIADQAAAAGMDVRRVFHPKATIERVQEQIQGAKFVVYLGHGNGWPSPYAPFQEKTKNGFGLNPYEGGSQTNHKYYGANWIRSNVTLGQHAVVLLIGACYSQGNGESGMAIPTEDVARQRVDNFAAGFLAVGAGAVYAFPQQRANIPQLLMTSDMSFDEIFMIAGTGSPTGYIGWRDRYFASQRTAGARNHLDPHSSQGYKRAVSGWLNTTATDWRDGTTAAESGPPPPPPPSSDLTPPSAPPGFTAQAGGTLQVDLAWRAATDDRDSAIKYRVVRNGTRIATVSSLAHVDKPSAAGTYRYKVRAVDAAGNLGPFSPEISVAVSAASASSSGPTMPTGLATESLGYRYVKLTWKASTSSRAGDMRYRIFRNGNRIATVKTLSYTDRPRNAGTYNYKIRAIDSAGYKSPFTPVVTGRAIKGPL